MSKGLGEVRSVLGRAGGSLEALVWGGLGRPQGMAGVMLMRLRRAARSPRWLASRNRQLASTGLRTGRHTGPL